VGKAAAGANDIMGASAPGVKYFLDSNNQIGQIGKSITIRLQDYRSKGFPRGRRLTLAAKSISFA
jgi:hypothetical protein